MMNRAHSRQVYLHASARDVVVPGDLGAAFEKSDMPVFSQHCQTSKPL